MKLKKESKTKDTEWDGDISVMDSSTLKVHIPEGSIDEWSFPKKMIGHFRMDIPSRTAAYIPTDPHTPFPTVFRSIPPSYRFIPTFLLHCSTEGQVSVVALHRFVMIPT